MLRRSIASLRASTTHPSRPSLGIGMLALLLAGLLGAAAPPAQAQHPRAITSFVNSAQDTTLETNHNGSLLLPGTFVDDPTANDSIPAEGAGTRLLWYPAKAAFRAGRVSNDFGDSQWDADSIGQHSVAFGVDTRASGRSATAMGAGTIASGQTATAMGAFTIASGVNATAMGDVTVASGQDATAMGSRTSASGIYATAMGRNTDAATSGSLSLGVCNDANTSDDGTLLAVGNGDQDLPECSARSDAMVLKNDAGFLVGGEHDIGSIPTEGPGTRMMWYPAKSAFRAGRVGEFKDGSQWDADSIGQYSAAFGVDTKASGKEAVAMGAITVASGRTATAMGNGTTASGENATAMGAFTTASAQDATAMGEGTTASGAFSTAMGDGTTASGDASTAMGFDTEASAPRATAMGSFTTASSGAATAMGRNTTASGESATAMGEGTTASGTRATAMGRNTTAATTRSLTLGECNSANTTEDATLLAVGNGLTSGTDCDTQSDALVLGFNGNLTISGTLTENSDRRLKTSVEPLRDGLLQKLGRLRPVRFQFKNERTHPSGTQIGLIAQDVQKEFPALVSKGSKGYLSLAYPKLTAVLLKGLQEQQARIDEHQARIEEQQDQLEQKQEQIDALSERVRQVERLQQRVAQIEAQSSEGTIGAGLSSGLPSGAGVVLAALLGLGIGLLWRRRA